MCLCDACDERVHSANAIAENASPSSGSNVTRGTRIRGASEGAEDGDAGAARPPAGGGGAYAADGAMGGVTTDDFIEMCDGFLNDDAMPSSSFPLDTLDERFWNDNLGVSERKS